MAYEFRFDDCAILVFYAVERLEDEVAEGTPSFVFGESAGVGRRAVMQAARGVVPDRAPYLTESTREEVEDWVMRVLESGRSATALTQRLHDFEVWLDERPEAFFLYQLEPRSIAGDGTARHLGLEAEKKKPI